MQVLSRNRCAQHHHTRSHVYAVIRSTVKPTRSGYAPSAYIKSVNNYITPSINQSFILFAIVMNAVTWLRYWQGNGLAIHRSRVQVLAGHRCVVAFGKLLTHACLCRQASSITWYRPSGVISLAAQWAWWKVTAAFHRVYD